ncbi:hypothetical protein GQ42DRAFT_155115 [Ramicandelaber brevisporus]|nr:hypothetical protein GQ42DRAFT_155115 [Ramicandelaber brevisporus]
MDIGSRPPLLSQLNGQPIQAGLSRSQSLSAAGSASGPASSFAQYGGGRSALNIAAMAARNKIFGKVIVNETSAAAAEIQSEYRLTRTLKMVAEKATTGKLNMDPSQLSATESAFSPFASLYSFQPQQNQRVVSNGESRLRGSVDISALVNDDGDDEDHDGDDVVDRVGESRINESDDGLPDIVPTSQAAAELSSSAFEDVVSMASSTIPTRFRTHPTLNSNVNMQPPPPLRLSNVMMWRMREGTPSPSTSAASSPHLTMMSDTESLVAPYPPLAAGEREFEVDDSALSLGSSAGNSRTATNQATAFLPPSTPNTEMALSTAGTMLSSSLPSSSSFAVAIPITPRRSTGLGSVIHVSPAIRRVHSRSPSMSSRSPMMISSPEPTSTAMTRSVSSTGPSANAANTPLSSATLQLPPPSIPPPLGTASALGGAPITARPPKRKYTGLDTDSFSCSSPSETTGSASPSGLNNGLPVKRRIQSPNTAIMIIHSPGRRRQSYSPSTPLMLPSALSTSQFRLHQQAQQQGHQSSQLASAISLPSAIDTPNQPPTPGSSLSEIGGIRSSRRGSNGAHLMFPLATWAGFGSTSSASTANAVTVQADGLGTDSTLSTSASQQHLQAHATASQQQHHQQQQQQQQQGMSECPSPLMQILGHRPRSRSSSLYSLNFTGGHLSRLTLGNQQHQHQQHQQHQQQLQISGSSSTTTRSSSGSTNSNVINTTNSSHAMHIDSPVTFETSGGLRSPRGISSGNNNGGNGIGGVGGGVLSERGHTPLSPLSQQHTQLLPSDASLDNEAVRTRSATVQRVTQQMIGDRTILLANPPSAKKRN